MADTGILNFSLDDFKEAARIYRKDFLRLPILSLNDDLKFMTPRMGVRYSEVVMQPDLEADFVPYKRRRREFRDLNIIMRELRTYFGALDYDFEPNSAIQTILGHRASQAAGQPLASTPTAREVLALVAKKAGYNLKYALFSATRDADGNSSLDLFDGFDTIANEEVQKGNISAAKKNYFRLSAKPDATNAVAMAKDILHAMSPELRAQECFIFCTQDFVDAYNENYLATHPAVPYNTKYNQTSVEGSNGMLTFVPLLGKQDSPYMQVTPKANMLVGMDQMSDLESVRIGDYDPNLITLSMRMFFGVQYESIDPRRLLLVEIPD